MKKEDKKVIEVIERQISSGFNKEDLDYIERMKTACIVNLIVDKLIKNKIFTEKEFKDALQEQVNRMHKINIAIENKFKEGLPKDKPSYIG